MITDRFLPGGVARATPSPIPEDRNHLRAVKRGLGPYAYVLPALLVFGLFLAFPVGFAIWLSLHSWNGFVSLGKAPYVGLANYNALRSDPIFKEALVNTLVFTVASTIIQMAIAFVLAFALWFYKLRFSKLLRALYFFPVVLSMVMVGITWRQLLGVGGPVDSLFHSLQLSQPDWLGSPNLVLWVVIWVSTWQWAGWTMVLYLAGMIGIPNEVVEAAKLDGAGSFQVLRTIVVPMVRYVTGLALLLNVIGGFQVFDTIYVMTGGGPNQASEVLGTYSYWQAFSDYGPGQLGYAGTIAIVMVIVLFVFSFVRVRMSRLV